jgi:hypothetical protein
MCMSCKERQKNDHVQKSQRRILSPTTNEVLAKHVIVCCCFPWSIMNDDLTSFVSLVSFIGSYLRHSNVVASIVTRMPFAVAIGIFCGSIKTTQSFSRGDHMWFSTKRRWHGTQRGFLSSESSSAIINVSLLVSCVHCLFSYQTITNTCLVVLILRIGDDSHESRGRGMQDCIVWKEKLAEFQKVRLICNRTRHLHAWLDSRGRDRYVYYALVDILSLTRWDLITLACVSPLLSFLNSSKALWCCRQGNVL